MAIIIPRNFNVQNELLDPGERLIRDQLKLNITNWIKFRKCINVGNDSSVLFSATGLIPKNIKDSYNELAKSHYEVVNSLGYTYISLQNAKNCNDMFSLRKFIKEFYYHAGCLLDNIARLIYIINDPCAPWENKSRNNPILLRHWMDWGELVKNKILNYPNYKYFKKLSQIKQIYNIRHIITHGWTFPYTYDHNKKILYWPSAIRYSKDKYLWPYDENILMKKKYIKWIPIIQTIEKDYHFIEKIQNSIFNKLTKDVIIFEKNNNVVIT